MSIQARRDPNDETLAEQSTSSRPRMNVPDPCRRGDREVAAPASDTSTSSQAPRYWHDHEQPHTAGLNEVSSPQVVRLRDRDRLDLRITPVRENLRGADVRMMANNGSVPGPTLHVEQLSEVTVDTRNDGDAEHAVDDGRAAS